MTMRPAVAPNAPALVEGQVMHVRARPAANAFRYPAFCLRLPLGALADLPSLGVAHNGRGLVSFHDRDHGARDGSSEISRRRFRTSGSSTARRSFRQSRGRIFR